MQASLLLPLPPELCGRESCVLAEEAGEVVGIGEAEGVGDVVDALGGVGEQGLGPFDDLAADVLLGGDVELALYDVAEVVGGEVELLGAPGYGGLPELAGQGAAGGKVGVEEGVEAAYEVALALVLLVELALEEALAVAEQLPDAEAQHVAGEFVVGGVELGVDVGEAVDHDASLALGELEGFADVVVEVVEHVEVAPQSGVDDELGVEGEHPSLGCNGGVEVHGDDLAGLEREDGACSVTHPGSVLDELAEVDVHEDDAVHAEVGGDEEGEVGLLEACHADEGVGGGLVEVAVVLLDAAYGDV